MSTEPQTAVREDGRRRERPPAKVDHFTTAERAARGKAARAEAPRGAHAEWEPPPNRPDPVRLLEQQDETRVPELVPIRYGRMLVSPFTFYRGAAAIMAADLTVGPRSGLNAQLCGDAHLLNFGVYAAPDRRLVFSLNDFDETLPGPFEWDVKRLAASFAIAGRDRNFSSKARARINMTVGRSYREAMRQFASMGNMDLWYARMDVDEFARDFSARATGAAKKVLQKGIDRARTKDSLKAFSKLCRMVDGEPRIVSDPPLIVPVNELVEHASEEAIHEAFRVFVRKYRRTLPSDRRRLVERFRYVDAARKVVGVGSVGTRAWIVLMLGHDEGDPLFLQAKEAQPSVLEPYLGRTEYANQGQRVVEGQRLMQAASDILLGWIRTEGIDGVERDFYIRQLWDAKGSAPVEVMVPSGFEEYARICGWMLAKGHARSGDAVAIAAYLGTSRAFDNALAEFAESYADQNERDYDALRRAVDSGSVIAETGV
jgi:uncharacterized protein (DUF2252 family)